MLFKVELTSFSCLQQFCQPTFHLTVWEITGNRQLHAGSYQRWKIILSNNQTLWSTSDWIWNLVARVCLPLILRMLTMEASYTDAMALLLYIQKAQFSLTDAVTCICRVNFQSLLLMTAYDKLPSKLWLYIYIYCIWPDSIDDLYVEMCKKFKCTESVMIVSLCR